MFTIRRFCLSLLAVLAAFTVILTIPAPQAQAAPTPSPRSVTVRASTAQNAKWINSALKSQGVSAIARAAILGNAYVDTGINPEWVGGPSIGVFGWQNLRAQNLRKQAKKEGLKWNSATLQAHFIVKELKTFGLFTIVNRARTVSAATTLIARNYIMCADISLATRIGAANSYYAKIRSGTI